MQVWFDSAGYGSGRNYAQEAVNIFSTIYDCRVDDSANQRSRDSYVFNIKPNRGCPFTRNNQIPNAFGNYPLTVRRVNALCTHGFEYLIRYLFSKGAVRVKTGFVDGGDFRSVEEFNEAAWRITQKWEDACTHDELPPPLHEREEVGV